MEAASPLDQLASHFDQNWPNITRARQSARKKRDQLSQELENFGSQDASIVVFGSLAREELTAGSDLDWTLLIDGQADPFHHTTAVEIGKKLEQLAQKQPNPAGAFGNLTFSHALIHQIGGDEDSNKNTTRRLLLLLESAPIGASEAYRRVLHGVLTRYLYDDASFRDPKSTGRRVPHFLLNDVARYWRTVAVDFAHKRRTRTAGSALRNIKLRFSRKLLYIAGLLSCFSFEIEADVEERKALFAHGEIQPLIAWLLPKFRRTPLERVAGAVLAAGDFKTDAAAANFFKTYDRFLAIIDDKEQRAQLEGAGGYDSEAYRQARAVSHSFRDSITRIFLTRQTKIGSLTLDYGVF